MSILSDFLELQHSARRAHCRVKQWQVELGEPSWNLAYQLAWYTEYDSPSAIHDKMCIGIVHIFGAPITVIDPTTK